MTARPSVESLLVGRFRSVSDHELWLKWLKPGSCLDLPVYAHLVEKPLTKSENDAADLWKRHREWYLWGWMGAKSQTRGGR